MEEVGMGLLGAGLGAAQGAINTNQNKKSQQRAFGMQKELNQQGKDLALQQWKDTNYSAQRKEMEKAGLSIGLMYEGGGAGGQTATGSGGSAPTQAPVDYNVGMGMQGLTTLSQIKLMEAQTNKTNAEAEKIAGADTQNTTADTALKTMQTANQEIINNVGNKTIDEQILAIKANADKAQSEARTELIGANINEETQKAKTEQIKNESIASALEAGLKQSNINLNEAQIKNMAEQIAIGKFNANNEAEFKGLDKVAGSQINKVINKIYETFGVKEETQTQNKIK